MEGTGVYQDGSSAKQYSCRVVLSDDVLNVYIENESNDFQIWSLKSFQSCHLNGSALIIKHGIYPHQTLECGGSFGTKIYEAWSQRNIIRRVEGLTFSRGLISALVLSVTFILLCLGFYFYVLPWTAEKAANLVPIEAEIELGDRISEIYASDGHVNVAASENLQKFTNKLRLIDSYPIRITVINSEQINAFALPGGRIFVYSGIIEKMNSHEELVALLGHEITHVVNRHSLKSICRSAASGIVIASLFGDVTGISSGILSQADKFKELEYSRDLETEADNNGLQIMIDNKVNPSGMLNLLEILKKESNEMPGLMKYLSTHPDTEARIENIKAHSDFGLKFNENEELKTIFRDLTGSF
jgi:Zn-dependent protease with chaperone function